MEKENINFYKVIISAYLHDVGKLLWRGGFDRIRNNDETDYKIAHAQHLRDIIIFGEKYKDINPISDYFSSDSEFWKDIAYIGSLHHKDDKTKYNEVFNYIDDKKEIEFRKKYVFIVYMADNIASLDRFKEESEKIDKYENNSIKEVGLGNIFDNIYSYNINSKYEFNPETLENLSIPGDITSDFSGLASKFYKDLINLLKENENIYTKEEDDLKKFVYDLDLLCQRYFTLVPSDAFQGQTHDLSLYDHVKITACISAILYKRFVRGEKTNLTIETKDALNTEISIIAGDFPSIQKYIFGGIKKQKHLAKRLRARSLRVQLMTEAIIQYILDKMGYTRSNVIMNAGGKFVIITDKDENRINEIKLSINKFLIKNFNNQINFNLILENDLKIGNVFSAENSNEVKEVFIKLFDKLAKNKFHIFEEENLKNIFKNESISGKVSCKYCGSGYLDKSDENDEENKCENCKKEIFIGENLVKSNSIFIKYEDNGEFKYDENFDNGDLKILFNNWDYENAGDKIAIGKSINLFVPKDEKGETKDFETIIQDDQGKENGLKYICMLKGDIDMMSILLKHGFPDLDKEKTLYSVNRFTQFSRFLELFFGLYLKKKLEEKEKLKNIYTVFSGGDDFVFIVPFSVRQYFINFLNEQFKLFVRNEKIHFSLGLGVFKDKTPFKQMDEITENLLKQAKNKSKKKIVNLSGKEDDQERLKYRGITVYEEDFCEISKEKDNFDFIEGIKKWDKNKKETEKEDDYYDKLKIDELELCISDTQSYTLYSELTKAKEQLECEDVDWGNFLLIGARIINMLGRNKNDTDKKGFKNMKNDIVKLIKTLDEKEEKIDKINEILLGLVDNMYKNRYKNN